jgi:hypothetical protein
VSEVEGLWPVGSAEEEIVSAGSKPTSPICMDSKLQKVKNPLRLLQSVMVVYNHWQ